MAGRLEAALTDPVDISDILKWTDLLVDEQYEALCKTFTASGKGRRPNLPPIHVDNKLCLQLCLLKQETGSTWEKLRIWFLQICPGISKGRIRNLMERTLYTFLCLNVEEKRPFLDISLDLVVISPELSSLGITRTNVARPEDQSPDDFANKVLPNKCVIDIKQFLSTSGLPFNTLVKWLKLIFPCATSEVLEKRISLCSSLYSTLLKNKHRDPTALEMFLNECFVISNDPVTVPVSVGSKPKKDSCSCTVVKDKVQRLQSEVKTLKDIINDLHSEKSNLQSKLVAANMHIERCQSSIKHLEDEKSKMIKRQSKKRRQFKACKKANSDEVELMKSQLVDMSLKCDKLTSVARKLRKRLKVDSKKTNETEIFCTCEGNSVVDIKEPVKNAYSASMRTTVLSLMSVAGVSAHNVSKCISFVSENLFNYKFAYLPCAKTCVKICDEGNVICHVQNAEEILSSANATLHSDGTSRDQEKIVGHQVSLGNGNVLYLGFSPVACEDANTLLEITIKLFRTLSEIYGEYTDECSSTILKKLLGTITSTMTDRAATMKVFGREFESFLREELGESIQVSFLHCNAHFLLGMSSACEKALRVVEQELIRDLGEDGGLGRDKQSIFARFCSDDMSATSRTIKHACELLGPRGDQKNGYRHYWLTHCTNSTIPSFRSNRFNCFYAAAAALIFHLDQIRNLFSSGVLPDSINQKMLSLSFDVNDSYIMSLICVIAIIYVKVTGPYWTLLNSQVKYTEFHVYVKKLCTFFSKCSEDPSWMLDRDCVSVFGAEFQMSAPAVHFVNEFISECDAQHLSFINNAIVVICKELVLVTERQLADFLYGSFSTDMSNDVIAALEHCPLTNLIGESAFGDFDFDVHKRRNCSLFNRSSIHMMKRNKTVEYIKSKDTSKRDSLFKFSRKYLPILKKSKREEEANVKIKIKEKMAENQEQQIQKQMKSISVTANLTALVKRYGGPCTRSEDVDALCRRVSQSHSTRHVKEAVKNEIRFQKSICKKSKLNLKGDLEQLVVMLKIHFDTINALS